MPCFVYASLRKAGSYLWLAERDAFARLPEPLLLLLGELRFVMEVQLDEQRSVLFRPHEVSLSREAVAEHLAGEVRGPDDKVLALCQAVCQILPERPAR